MENNINIWSYIYEWLTDAYNFTVGLLMSILGYFLPIKDIMQFMLLLFLADVVFGYLRARKVEKAKFQPKIIWNKTVPRLLFTVIIISLLYRWDSVYEQEFVKTYSIAGWFVSGLLIASIAKNMYDITNWNAFSFLKIFISSKIEEKTGQKIEDDE